MIWLVATASQQRLQTNKFYYRVICLHDWHFRKSDRNGLPWHSDRMFVNVHGVSKKFPPLNSVTLSDLNRFSKFLHCWKAYQICYESHVKYPPHVKHRYFPALKVTESLKVGTFLRHGVHIRLPYLIMLHIFFAWTTCKLVHNIMCCIFGVVFFLVSAAFGLR